MRLRGLLRKVAQACMSHAGEPPSPSHAIRGEASRARCGVSRPKKCRGRLLIVRFCHGKSQKRLPSLPSVASTKFTDDISTESRCHALGDVAIRLHMATDLLEIPLRREFTLHNPITWLVFSTTREIQSVRWMRGVADQVSAFERYELPCAEQANPAKFTGIA